MIDYVAALSIDFSLIYPEIALLVAAFVILLTSFIKKLSPYAVPVAVGGFLAALIFSLEQWGHQGSGFAGMVTCDDFGIFFKVLFIVAGLLSMLIAIRYLREKNIEKPEYYALLLISIMGMMTMANSTDLIVIFLGLEIMSVPLYVLAAFNQRSLESNEAGIKYFLMGAFASAFLLMGIAFVFGASETTNLRRIVADFSYISANHSVYLYAGVAFLLTGFGFKVAAVPFHLWVPDVYQGAPTPVTSFFAVAPKAAGFAVILRVFTFGFAEVSQLTDIFWIIAVLTMTVGNVMALRQNNVKRMLAYSSISHAGYLFVAITVGGIDAVSSAAFYLVGYMIFTIGAFTVLTMMETRSGSKCDYSELAGMSRVNPFVAAMLALFMLALAGFPPTVGFFGKFYVFSAAVRAGFITLAVLGVLNSFISVYYYLRVIKTAYFDDAPNGSFVPLVVTPTLFFVLVVVAAGTIGIGIFPQRLLELSEAAIFAFL